MSFLKTSAQAGKPEGCNPLPAGVHLVKLEALRYTNKAEKIIADFVTPDGSGFYTEWLGLATAGQEARTGAFIRRLGELAGKPAPDFETVSDFDAYGKTVVGTQLRIALVDDVYDEITRQVLAGRFEESLTSARSNRAF